MTQPNKQTDQIQTIDHKQSNLLVQTILAVNLGSDQDASTEDYLWSFSCALEIQNQRTGFVLYINNPETEGSFAQCCQKLLRELP
eukprot:1473658-Amphidinium_carterae.1